jgi:hypothetical protein
MTVGTIRITVPTTLIWHARGPIQVFTSKGFLIVDSQAPSGGVRLSKGQYPGLRVVASGAWSVELRVSR